MPNSITKNKKDEKMLRKMLRAAFPEQEVERMEELTEGYFNVAYLITLSDKTEVILKIAPPPELEVMTYENNIMFTEVDTMRRLERETQLPVAKILFYDNSRSICDSEYFIMEKLKGKSFVSCMNAMSQEQKDRVNHQIGEYNAVINGVKGRSFGYYGQPKRQGVNWYKVFRGMIFDAYYDAQKKSIEIKVSKERLLKLLLRDRAEIELVKQPVLVHWDLWAGNIFVCEDKVTGLIDFERCLWADKLMEVGFRTYGDGPERAFLNGYGVEVLSQEELIRAAWYDIYLFLVMSLEYDYRLYDDKSFYEEASRQLIECTDKLETMKA